MKRINFYLFIGLCSLLFGCIGRNHSLSDVEHDHDHDHEEVIHFSREQADALGLQVETIQPAAFQKVIKTSGFIQTAQADEVILSATANGIVHFKRHSLSLGMQVNSGEPLVVISAQQLPEGDPALQARLRYEAAQKESERAELLVKEQIISMKEFEEIQLRYLTAKNMYLSQSEQYSEQGIVLNSPVNGYIKDIFVKQGDYVSVGQPMAQIVRNRHLQLRAEVPETYFGQLDQINDAHFILSYSQAVHKLSDLNGKLLAIGKATTDQSFFLPVTFEFDYSAGILPGAFAEIFLLGEQENQIISVPLSAITEEQGLYFVYLQIDNEEYKKQEVQPGQSNGERVHIVQGLSSGDRVVIHGTYQIKLAATATVIPEGHTH